jgi:hypothetical protein
LQEAGKQVNLSDWYDQFLMPARVKAGEGEWEEADELLDVGPAARFVVSVAGLAWQGLLHRSTKLRPDHVMRTVF